MTEMKPTGNGRGVDKDKGRELDAFTRSEQGREREQRTEEKAGESRTKKPLGPTAF